MPTLVSAAATSAREEKQPIASAIHLKWLKKHKRYTGSIKFDPTGSGITPNGTFYANYPCFTQKEKSYHFKLVLAKFLSDKDKLAPSLVMTPHFEQLKKASQDEKDKHFQLVCSAENLSFRPFLYPFTRLFIAALCHAGANPNVSYYISNSNKQEYVLGRAFLERDIGLIKLLLQSGADAKQKVNLDIVDLLFDKEVSDEVREVRCRLFGNKTFDLIEICCGILKTMSQPENLKLYLKHVPLDDSNKNGSYWIETLAQCAQKFEIPELEQHLNILLEHGCIYNKDEISYTFSNPLNQVSNERKQAFLAVLEAHENEKKLQDLSLEMNQVD